MSNPRRVPYPPCVASNRSSANPKDCVEHTRYGYIWPDLVGKPADVARDIIAKDNPLVTIVPVPPRSPVLDNLCCNRVYLKLDDNNRVKTVPRIG